jgi:signal transduction histidine kinase
MKEEEDIILSEIPFTVSARTARLIGQENFANAEGAIIELVKNAYDADAKNCIIIFDNDTLYIIDNGIGMTENIIRTHWMTIGTEDKLQNVESIGGRIKTGAKGIGRFALDRLGGNSEMITYSRENERAYKWNVDWSAFNELGITIDKVKAKLGLINAFNYQLFLKNLFPDFIEYQHIIQANEFIYGTVHKIFPLKEKWAESSIRSLFDNLEILIPPKEQPEFAIHLFYTHLSAEFGNVNCAFYDDFDYKISSKYLENTNTVKIGITRNEMDIEQLETKYIDLFKYPQMQKFPYDLDTLKNKYFEKDYQLSDLKGFSNVSKELISKIGRFDFTFYFLKNTISDDKSEGDKRKYPYRFFESSPRKAWLNKFGGVKIFRDDFRVRPYGENGEDWLKLGERQAQSPGGAGQKLGGYRIKQNQIAGTINISRLTNLSFQDKSGREGIQENDVFELFKNLIITIISIFEQDRNVIMFYLSELAKERYKDEAEKVKAREAAERVNKEKEDEESKRRNNTIESDRKKSSFTETEALLARGNIILEQELEDKEKEIQMLRSLASVGLIISSFAHEVKSLRSRLIPRTSFLVKKVKSLIDEKKLINLPKEDNPLYDIQLITEEDIKLKHWLDYSLSSLKKDKRTRTNVHFSDYFEKFKATWEKALNQKSIKIYLNGFQDSSFAVKAFEVDLDSIFNNLLSNSVNSLTQVSYNKKITISWKKKDSSIEIVFQDNGVGLSTDFQSNPDEIFNAFETSKRDRKGTIIGTGLGLYIVKSIISEHRDSTIEILPTDIGFALKIVFPIR